jgi:transglutaminase-like putative cysteine protease
MTMREKLFLLIILLVICSFSSSPAFGYQKPIPFHSGQSEDIVGPGLIIEREDEVEGIIFRFFWYVPAKNGISQLLEFSFPVYHEYPTHSVHYVSALYPGGLIERDEFGTYWLSYSKPLTIVADQALLLGFAAAGSFYTSSRAKILLSEIAKDHAIPLSIQRHYLDNTVRAFDLSQSTKQEEIKLEVCAANDPYQSMRNVWDFVRGHMFYKTPHRPNTAGELLDLGYGWCGEFTRLTIALLRVCGIPARGVYGFRFHSDGPTGNAHTWAEAYLPGGGWLPVQSQNQLPKNDVYPYPQNYVMKRYVNEYHDDWITWSLTPELDRPAVYTEQKTLHYDISLKNAKTRWISGSAFFVSAKANEAENIIDLVSRIAADDGKMAAMHYQETTELPKEHQAFPLYLLAASRNENIAVLAAKTLEDLAHDAHSNLDLDKFIDIAPEYVRKRILHDVHINQHSGAKQYKGCSGELDLGQSSQFFGYIQFHGPTKPIPSLKHILLNSKISPQDHSFPK